MDCDFTRTTCSCKNKYIIPATGKNLLDKAVSIFFGHTNNVLYVVTDAAIYSFTYGMGNEVSVSTTSQFTPSNGEKLQKPSYINKGNIPIKLM